MVEDWSACANLPDTKPERRLDRGHTWQTSDTHCKSQPAGYIYASVLIIMWLRSCTRQLRGRPLSKSWARTLSSSLPSQPQQDNVRKLPSWAAKYADRFKNHPTSHITSFLILHELTAVLPLPILWWFFHSFDWTPDGLPTEALEKGIEVASKQLKKWGLIYTGDDGSRYIFEGAAAYAVVKLLLPLRIATSLSLTPMFARRVVVPITRLIRRKKDTQ